MQTVLAFVVGGLYAASLYMMLRRSITKLIIGLALLGHAANLLILTAGRLVPGQPPLIPSTSEATRLEPPYADPLPQALILTAIVIGFGVQAFALVLIRRTYETVGTDDLDEMRSTDRA
ncbi:MAG TPA: Na+/H+ antiporter subunit C [Phycisphaerae bacterium]|nr:Na+/H+ antiporter subunit C [Phycisphaerae bacterium]HOB73047.1 Na+/H+ antiporter subunit C [Phycisphaerae bacterium]HOJ54072.1 Na+/H+ antiporter subunit C [Phycisphaerae bacterium]HOL26483.1 Na+/H+ antiporter subunit C [Phycisphaerae bacterium]HPP20462.1 Na+/H+ antiporter subunit C [Phycisphaerae bacterium]